jgi:hypothetical protein
LDGLIRPLKLSLTEPQPEFGIVQKGAFRIFFDQSIESPEGLFRFTPGKKNLSLPEEERILGLGLGQSMALCEEQKEKKENDFPSFIYFRD